MFKINNIEIDKALLLAPMEDVTDLSFRLVCKEFGADVVYTEFVNSEGLIRNVQKTHKKLETAEAERPVGIQIYGENIESMVKAAIIAEQEEPDLIDVNAGCWIKKICGRGAGAGLLKDPPYMQKMMKEIVDAVKLPVTVKTRIGWDNESIQILDVAKRLEDVGIKALTVHCRTRSQGHSGNPDWSWIPKIKEVVSIPVAVNGGIFTAVDAKRAFDETGADAVM
ncbi:MAG TPA: tRNA-dihydrouridine synthase family protein, partial [Ignavibacteriales bacterium]|nr:tRNA-dihydrouridine synthase family protein [Ignavibacteriales bacterium]